MAKRKRKRQRIDTMIDAHAWMRRQARTYGEWPHDQRPRAPPSVACIDASNPFDTRLRPKE
jgi:uncharacterized protein with von Willebrand factor type A (vWA) domain